VPSRALSAILDSVTADIVKEVRPVISTCITEMFGLRYP